MFLQWSSRPERHVRKGRGRRAGEGRRGFLYWMRICCLCFKTQHFSGVKGHGGVCFDGGSGLGEQHLRAYVYGKARG